jgi:hypothetical protein
VRPSASIQSNSLKDIFQLLARKSSQLSLSIWMTKTRLLN